MKPSNESSHHDETELVGEIHEPVHKAPRTPDEADRPARGGKPARGAPGSFDQPEPNPDVMPREGGPHPEQTDEVPLGSGAEGLPSGARGHNSAPVRRKPG